MRKYQEESEETAGTIMRFLDLLEDEEVDPRLNVARSYLNSALVELDDYIQGTSDDQHDPVEEAPSGDPKHPDNKAWANDGPTDNQFSFVRDVLAYDGSIWWPYNPSTKGDG